MENTRELFTAILKFKPDAVRFKVLLGDRKEPSRVKRGINTLSFCFSDPSRMELVEEDMHKKNRTNTAEPTL